MVTEMKVKEFIDKLRNMPQDLELKIGTCDGIYDISDDALVEIWNKEDMFTKEITPCVLIEIED